MIKLNQNHSGLNIINILCIFMVNLFVPGLTQTSCLRCLLKWVGQKKREKVQSYRSLQLQITDHYRSLQNAHIYKSELT